MQLNDPVESHSTEEGVDNSVGLQLDQLLPEQTILQSYRVLSELEKHAGALLSANPRHPAQSLKLKQIVSFCDQINLHAQTAFYGMIVDKIDQLYPRESIVPGGKMNFRHYVSEEKENLFNFVSNIHIEFEESKATNFRDPQTPVLRINVDMKQAFTIILGADTPDSNLTTGTPTSRLIQALSEAVRVDSPKSPLVSFDFDQTRGLSGPELPMILRESHRQKMTNLMHDSTVLGLPALEEEEPSATQSGENLPSPVQAATGISELTEDDLKAGFQYSGMEQNFGRQGLIDKLTAAFDYRPQIILPETYAAGMVFSMTKGTMQQDSPETTRKIALDLFYKAIRELNGQPFEPAYRHCTGVLSFEIERTERIVALPQCPEHDSKQREADEQRLEKLQSYLHCVETEKQFLQRVFNHTCR